MRSCVVVLVGSTLASSCGEGPSLGANLAPPILSAAEVTPGASSIVPSVGTGWDLSAENYVGRCIGGSTRRVPPPVEGRLRVSGLMNSRTALTELGFSMGAKAHFGIASGSIKATAAQSMSTDAFSTVWVFEADYIADSDELDFEQPIRLTAIGEQAAANNTWQRDCGDEFVYQIQKGAKLFVIYRLDFRSESARRDLEARVSGKSTFGEVNAELRLLSNMLAKQARLSVEAYQFGGEPWKLGGVVNGATESSDQAREGARALARCGASDLGACETFITNAVTYATDMRAQDGFAKQVERRASAKLYITAPWARLNRGTERNLGNEMVKTARRDLEQFFDRLLRVRLRVERLLASSWVGRQQRAEIAPWQETLDGYDVDVMDAVQACYDKLILQATEEGRASVLLCTEMGRRLKHLPLPSDVLLGGDLEKAISARWKLLYPMGSVDPAENATFIGDTACGQDGLNAVCAYNIDEGVVTHVLDLRHFRRWQDLAPDARSRIAQYPVSDTLVEGDMRTVFFYPHTALVWSPASPGLPAFIHDALWDFWQRAANRRMLGPPIADQETLPGSEGQAVHFRGTWGPITAYWTSGREPQLMPKATYDAWRNKGGASGCLGAPTGKQAQEHELTITCFERGEIHLNVVRQDRSRPGVSCRGASSRSWYCR
jgi:hypothetical protein